MENTKVRPFQVNQLRLWKENPRYTEYADIKINEIGSKDFVISPEPNTWIIEDLYSEQITSIIGRLFNSYEKAKSMRDLIESMSNGFDSGIDDIIVVKPKKDILSMAENKWSYLKDIYYVVEGNRRLTSILLLLNENNEIERLIKFYKDKVYKNIKDITIFHEENEQPKIIGILENIQKFCINYNNNNYDRPFLKVIHCTELDYDFYTSEEGIIILNKTLNAKHFGVRKGKLNWPRGLMLKKIFNYTERFLTHNNEHGKDIQSKELFKYIEDRTGKKIASNDIASAIFVSEFVRIWNKNNPNEKIELHETEPGDIAEVESSTYIDDSGKEIFAEGTIRLSISALELSKNKIMILNKKYEKVPLSKVLKFKSQFKNINSLGLEVALIEKNIGVKIDDNQLKQLVNIIIRGIIDKKITTREADDEIGREIRSLFYKENELSFEKTLDLSLEDLYNISLSKENLDENTNKILKNVKEIIDYAEEFLSLEENQNMFIKTINYIWKIEYGRIIKFKSITILKEFPILIFSGLLRTTVEFICSVIVRNMLLEYLKNYDFINDFSDAKNPSYQLLCKNIFQYSVHNDGLIGKFLSNDWKDLDSKFKYDSIDRNLIVEDVAKLLDIWMCNEDFNDIKSNFETNMFDIKKIPKIWDKNLNADAVLRGVKLKLEDFQKLICPVILENKFYFSFLDSKNVSSIIYLVEKMLFSEQNNTQNQINRFIHKASFSVEAYLNKRKFIEILTLLAEIEKVILNIVK